MLLVCLMIFFGMFARERERAIERDLSWYLVYCGDVDKDMILRMVIATSCVLSGSSARGHGVRWQ